MSPSFITGKTMIDRPAKPANGGEQAAERLTSAPAEVDQLLLLEESAAVSKRKIVTGTVRVTTHTETRQEIAEVSLDRNVVDVTRVPVGKVVDTAPSVRTEDNTTIVPVIEERFVVVKQLFLLEEIHIRHRVEHEVSSVPVELKRQTASVERIDPAGHVMPAAEPDIQKPHRGAIQGE